MKYLITKQEEGNKTQTHTWKKIILFKVISLLKEKQKEKTFSI